MAFWVPAKLCLGNGFAELVDAHLRLRVITHGLGTPGDAHWLSLGRSD